MHIVVMSLYTCLRAYTGVCISAVTALRDFAVPDQPHLGSPLTPATHGLWSPS